MPAERDCDLTGMGAERVRAVPAAEERRAEDGTTTSAVAVVCGHAARSGWGPERGACGRTATSETGIALHRKAAAAFVHALFLETRAGTRCALSDDDRG